AYNAGRGGSAAARSAVATAVLTRFMGPPPHVAMRVKMKSGVHQQSGLPVAKAPPCCAIIATLVARVTGRKIPMSTVRRVIKFKRQGVNRYCMSEGPVTRVTSEQ